MVGLDDGLVAFGKGGGILALLQLHGGRAEGVGVHHVHQGGGIAGELVHKAVIQKNQILEGFAVSLYVKGTGAVGIVGLVTAAGGKTGILGESVPDRVQQLQGAGVLRSGRFGGFGGPGGTGGGILLAAAGEEGCAHGGAED